MKRVMWIIAAGGAVAIGGAALVKGRNAVVTSAAAPLSRSSSASAPFQTTVGIPLNIPEVIPLEWTTGRWQYSPDGTRLAMLALNSVWVWNFDSNEVVQLTSTADDEQHGAVFHGMMFWTDDGHILARETHNSFAEGAAWSADHSLPLPEIGFRWVLLDSRTGQRIRSVADRVNADAWGMLDVVGVVDADVWYIKARDGKLRTYDSRTRTVGSQAYFDYNGGNGRAAQIAPGSDWFSALDPAEPPDPQRPSRGRLDVFNIQTGEVRSVDDIYLPTLPALITPDGRYLFTTETGEDGNGVPEIYDLGLGIQVPLPAAERWGIWSLSASRGVLLVGIGRPGDAPNVHAWTWEYAEVPLSYLTQR